MSLKKDKAKVLDEVWTEERIRGFLDIRAPSGVNVDFHTLLKAYQQMRAEDFGAFLQMFTAEGRDVDAVNERGETLLMIVSQHRNAPAYAEILTAAGARS